MADKNKTIKSQSGVGPSSPAWVQSFMLSRFLHFYDQFNDGEVDSAIRIFENPFASAAGEDANEEQDTGDGPQVDSAGETNNKQTTPPAKKKQAVSPISPAPGQSFKITLSDAKLESRIITYHKKNQFMDVNQMKLQAFMLTYLNDDKRNILHLACCYGNLKMTKFIVDQAKVLGILDIIVHARDELDHPPIYLLCERGYLKKFDPVAQAKEYKEQQSARKKMIELLIPPGRFDDSSSARWDGVARQVKYTILHWLAFWNDIESLAYLLENIEVNVTQYSKVMGVDHRGLTFLDMAGLRGCHEAVIMLLDFFAGKMDVIRAIFGRAKTSKNKVQATDEDRSNSKAINISNQPLIKDQQREAIEKLKLTPIGIRKTTYRELTPIQAQFARCQYWAAYYGELEFVNTFLEELGVSPFMKLYDHQNLVHAAVKGGQYEMLEFLIKDTRKGINDNLPEHKKFPVKYRILDATKFNQYWKTRRNRDAMGNSPLHFCYEIQDTELRYKMLSLLLEEGIGDVKERNKLGLLPQELEHDTEYARIPDNIKHLFKQDLRHTLEGDYMIVTSESETVKGKKALLLEQLDELHLKETTETFTIPAEDKKDPSKKLILISIKFPDEILNKEAEALGIETTLAYSQTKVFVKAPFSERMKRSFVTFDADEKVETIQEYLGKEIDFEYYLMTGTIEQHFPLHQKNDVKQMQECFAKYKFKLIFAFLFGGFGKYMQPINMMKNYYGEKYAFEYCFLLHYVAWLMIPSALGVAVLVRMLQIYSHTKSVVEAMDTDFNGILGVILAIWATCFLESWKRKQKEIQFLWNCADNSFSKQDERTEEFQFYNSFNERSKKIEKLKKEIKPRLKWTLTIIQHLCLTIVLFSMFLYQHIGLRFKPKYYPDGKLKSMPTTKEKIQGYMCTTVYSIVVILFGTIYKKLSLYQTEKDNHQYQRSWDDAYINRLFTVNFLNFYLPYFLVAFYIQRYEDLFIMLFSQMACKQVVANVVEYLKPLWTVKPKLAALDREFADCLKSFDEDSNQLPITTEMVELREKHQISLKPEAADEYTPKTEMDLKKNTQQQTLRLYQARRDLLLDASGAGVIDCYMELVVQFGFITLFSEVFPLAAMFSLLSNNIQINSQINNFTYERRIKAEVSNGIGAFMNCLEIIVKFGIISNIGTLFFTSNTIFEIFTTGWYDIKGFFPSWDRLTFAIFLICLEHGLMVCQMFIALVVDDTPEYVMRGDKERKDLLENYKTSLRECQHGDVCQREDTIDVGLVRRNMAEILQKVEEEIVREVEESNVRQEQKKEDKKPQAGGAADAKAVASPITLRKAAKPAANVSKPGRAAQIREQKERKAAQRTRNNPSEPTSSATSGTSKDPQRMQNQYQVLDKESKGSKQSKQASAYELPSIYDPHDETEKKPFTDEVRY